MVLLFYFFKSDCSITVRSEEHKGCDHPDISANNLGFLSNLCPFLNKKNKPKNQTKRKKRGKRRKNKEKKEEKKRKSKCSSLVPSLWNSQNETGEPVAVSAVRFIFITSVFLLSVFQICILILTPSEDTVSIWQITVNLINFLRTFTLELLNIFVYVLVQRKKMD